MEKLYYVFAGESCYPIGGSRDYCEKFDSDIEAIEYAKSIIGEVHPNPNAHYAEHDNVRIDWASVSCSEMKEIFKCSEDS
mgnify:CR=1 FL=1|tara:strand:+ start:130 stop:369 length:240 start_codon:yes stop_codon:yes gene_type:complete